MMYLKHFPDICREMGFNVEEKAPQTGANGLIKTGTQFYVYEVYYDTY